MLNICKTRLCSEAASFLVGRNTGVANLYRLSELLSVWVLYALRPYLFEELLLGFILQRSGAGHTYA